MFGCLWKIINFSFMDCLLIETREIYPPLIGNLQKALECILWNFWYLEVSREQDFFLLRCHSVTQIRAICFAFNFLGPSFIFYTLPVADSTVPPCFIPHQHFCSSKRLPEAYIFPPWEIIPFLLSF